MLNISSSLHKLCAGLLVLPLALVACGAGNEPAESEDENVQSTEQGLNGCPGTQQPCTCFSGPAADHCICLSTVGQCLQYCAGKDLNGAACGP
jgi:hypothetical protein